MADNKQVQVSVNINPTTTPILYTDTIFMSTNENGVVLDVGQRVGSTNQAQVITRIGMSRDHAKKFVEELGRLLAMTEGSTQTGKKQKN